MSTEEGKTAPAAVIVLDSIRRDTQAEEDGKWRPSFEWPEVVKYRLRPLRYGPFQTALRLKMRELVRKYKRGIPPEIEGAALGELYGQFLVVDWSGFDVKHSKANAIKTLGDPLFLKVRLDIEACLNTEEDDDVEYVEDALKN